ncbi:hypothetical protein IWW48_003141 [Coemansia sp. RSA 1200]|nr:hypothetical protein IWW48_003141 [Coemansia sp. RSA 1200]
MKLVLQASAAPAAKPASARQNKEVRNSAGQLVKSCLSSRSSVAQRPNTHQKSRMPRFVHFNAELEQARWFFKTDAPQCASRDAITCNESNHLKDTTAAFTRAYLTLTPVRGPSPSFLSFEESPVVLETVRYVDKMLIGTIKVHNLAFEKYVAVRLTNDGWKSVEDVQATFLCAVTGADGCRPGVDRFRFSTPIADTPSTADGAITISMCVCYRVNSEEHWDNNKGANYEFKLTVCSTSKSNAAVPTVVDDPGLISLATTASILAHGQHTSSNTFKRAYMLPSSSLNRVSAADTRRV